MTRCPKCGSMWLSTDLYWECEECGKVFPTHQARMEPQARKKFLQTASGRAQRTRRARKSKGKVGT